MSPQERFRELESCESRGTSVYILMTLHSGRPTLEFKLSTLIIYIIINKERVYFPRHNHHLEPRNTKNSIPVQRLQTQKDGAERKNKERITIAVILDRSLVCQI